MRSACAFALVVMATLVAPFAIGTTWVADRVADQDAYVDRVAPLADDPVVRSLLADAAAEGAIAAIEKHVPVGIPSKLEDWAHQAAEGFVESPRFPAFWRDANADVHRQSVGVLEDGDEPHDGMITIDATELVAQVLLDLEERGVPVDLLPEVPLEVPVVSEAKVAEAGPAYRLGDSLAWVLPLLWLALVAFAVVLGHRLAGRMRFLGMALLGVALAAGVVLLVAEPIADLVVERAELDRREVAGVVAEELTGWLAPYARWFLLAAPVGLLLLVASWWPGRQRESPYVPPPHALG